MRETEIKLRFADADEARRRLARIGATPLRPRVFEDNRLYDDASGSLRARRQLLRLRVAGERCTVTFKKPLDQELDDARYKVRVEHQTTIGDAEAFDALLRELGYRPTWRYQKFREVLRVGDLLVTVDETPIGVFVELEGAEADIDRVAASIGFGPDDYITKTYHRLHQEHTGADDPGDLVFAEPHR